MLQYTKKLNPAVFVPTFFLVILEIAKTFSSILLPQYFIDDITNRSSIRQTMFHLAILIIAIFGIQIFRAAITPYILNGTVFEDGTHQSLMAKESGIYKKMFTTQAAHYFSDPTTVAVVD